MHSLETDFSSLLPNYSKSHGDTVSVNKSENLSTFSSVSSVTILQEGDGISLDNSSLPGDPFPQGLPPISLNISLSSSSSSSTLESPPSSPIPCHRSMSPSLPQELPSKESTEPQPLQIIESPEAGHGGAIVIDTKGNRSTNKSISPLIKHSSESNLSRLDDDFMNDEEQKYVLLQSVLPADQVFFCAFR